MVFKVYFQETAVEVPIRENTKTIYVKAESEREVRAKLADRNLNIEFIQLLEGAHLEYEQQNRDYNVLEI